MSLVVGCLRYHVFKYNFTVELVKLNSGLNEMSLHYKIDIEDY